MGRHGDDDGDGLANQADPDWTPESDPDALAPIPVDDEANEPSQVARGAINGLTAATLREAMGNTLSLTRYQQLLPAFNSALVQAGCTTVNRAAMFCAQMGHESVGLKYGEEIASGAAYEGRRDLGNTQPGDGRRFKGHGWIQITGRLNHTNVSKWAYGRGYVPSPRFFVDHPEQLAADRYVWIGPVWYWTVARPDINSLCDRGDLNTVTRRINGGLNGLADRQRRWDLCRRIGTRLLPAPGGGSNDAARRYRQQALLLG